MVSTLEKKILDYGVQSLSCFQVSELVSYRCFIASLLHARQLNFCFERSEVISRPMVGPTVKLFQRDILRICGQLSLAWKSPSSNADLL